MEHDSYVKEPTKNVPTSNVISYLKENKLTSLIYTYPVEKGVFRNSGHPAEGLLCTT
jgi:hypothetical protein